MSFANSEMLPNIGGVLLPLMGRQLPIRMDSGDCLRGFHADCSYIEKHLAERKYLIAEQLTLADLFTVGCMVFAVKVFHRVLFAKYPRTMEWFKRVYEEPLFINEAGELDLLSISYPELPEDAT